jgi:hypothetical protein
MQWSDIPFHPPRKDLRQFAGLCLVVFGGMAIWQGFVRGNTVLASIFAAAAILIGPFGLARPERIRWIYVGWMIAAFPIGWAVSQTILAVLYFVLFTPIALFFKLVRRDPLHRTRRSDLTTYWLPKPAPADLKSYFKQF